MALGGRHDEYRSVRVLGNGVRDGSEQQGAQRREAARADHDHAGVHLPGHVEDRVCGAARGRGNRVRARIETGRDRELRAVLGERPRGLGSLSSSSRDVTIAPYGLTSTEIGVHTLSTTALLPGNSAAAVSIAWRAPGDRS